MGNFTFITKFRKPIFVGVAAVGLVSCNPRGTDLGALYNPGPRMDVSARVTYEVIRDSLIAPRCLSCHSEMNTEAGLSDYITPGNPSKSSLFTTMVDGSMPPGGPAIPASTLNLVERYINGLSPVESAPIPTPAPSPAPSPTQEPPASEPPVFTPVDFATLKSTVLAPRCNRCHDEMDTEEGLMDYVVAGQPEASSLYQSIVNGSMPPRKPLSAAETKMVSDYISGLKKQ